MRYLPLLILLWSCTGGDKLYQDDLANARSEGYYTNNVVVVSDYEEFISAIAPNTTILLQPGKYRITDSAILEGGTTETTRINGLSEYYEDSFIHDVENLSIIGIGDTMPSILQPDQYNHVLKFKNCSSIYIENVKLGHAPEVGWCVGGVAFFHKGSEIMLNNTHLFGSGTEGLTLINVDILTLKDSKITGCSEQLSTFSHSSNILFDGCQIMKNKASLRGFAVYRSDIKFKNTSIKYKAEFYLERDGYGTDSYDLFFYIDGDYDIGKWHVGADEIKDRGVSSTISFEDCLINDYPVSGEMK